MTTSHNWTYKGASRYRAWNAKGVLTNDTPSQQDARQDVLSKPTGPNGDHVRPNSFAASSRYVEAPDGMQVQHNSDGSRWTQEGVIGSINPINAFLQFPTGTYERVYNDALDRLNEKVRGSLDLSVDAAQLSQTARMFNLLRSVRSVTRGLHRSDGIWNGTRRTDPRVVVTLPSGVYLQWKYGWSPLLQSIYGLADEMARRSEDTGIAVRSRAKFVEELTPLSDVPLFNSSRVTLIPKGKRQARMEFKVWLRAPTGTTDLARLSSLNPMSIGYELIPYSFVMDWFVNIGGYIRNLETAMIYNRIFRMGYATYSTKVEGEYALSGTTQFANRTATGGGRFKATSINRQRLISYPTPQIPSFSMDLGSGQLMSAAALLGQRLKILR